MNHLDLFSGIGGFALALEIAGIPIHQTYFSEVNPYAIKVFSKNFPAAIPLGDIRNISGTELRKYNTGSWIVTGGFPCQDISTAGKGKGLAGERSGLWFEMLRIIDELKPEFVLAENVAALKGRGLIDVLRGLDGIGYDSEWTTLSAQEVGAIHQRRRLWITSYPRNAHGSPVERIDQLLASGRNLGNERQHDCETDWLITRSDWQRIEAERSYLGQPLIYRRTDGIPAILDRVTALGNAIVPQCAAQILRHRHDTPRHQDFY